MNDAKKNLKIKMLLETFEDANLVDINKGEEE